MTTITLTTDPHRARVRSTTTTLRPVTITCGPVTAKVALVPETALLLAGDRVVLDVTVGPGACLEIVETSGTVAYDMRGGSAGWDVRIDVQAGGTLIWEALPFVVSQGADVRRSLQVTLADDARLAMRETLVLGRHGEGPGRLRTTTRVTRSGQPLLVDDLDAEVLPNRVLDSVLVTGTDDGSLAGGMALAAGGRLWRDLVDDTHRSRLGSSWDACRRASLARSGGSITVVPVLP